ncbi:P-loop containing nucleoside triphosphate hydrolase protein [Stipitochalara longipes BDJ]|nr:P-loop containing nucleoside triphosphate hydrolase protein [Stipitochalara longipes BDJ]
MAPRKKKNADFGSNPVVKTFYQGQFGSWSEKEPKKLAPDVAKAYDSHAITVFKVKDDSKPEINGAPSMKISMLNLQSPILAKHVIEILAAESVFLDETAARLTSPFKALFFCYDKIRALHETAEKNSILKNHLTLLVDIMEEIFGEDMARRENMAVDLSRMTLPGHTFHEVALFSRPRVGHSVPRDCFPRKCAHRQSDELPTGAPSDQHGVKARLTERAKKVLEYQHVEYRHYNGLAILKQGGLEQKHNVNGRIVIDCFGYHKHHEGLQRTETRFFRHSADANAAASTQIHISDLTLDDYDYKDEIEETLPTTLPKVTSNYVTALAKGAERRNTKQMVSKPEELIFVSPMLQGFALKNKIWLNFYVDDIKPVPWNDEAWEHLVYNETRKDLVHTFVENHRRLKAGVDDVIAGKGLGLIILLSDPPGTGKTLRAEAVADKTRRPLYYLQAEDLGIDASTLGRNIKKVFELATDWDAVILLDEADVFMAERSPKDIARNELVSIFLRELEYFQGIIFLTTNLLSTIDNAFRSA